MEKGVNSGLVQWVPEEMRELENSLFVLSFPRAVALVYWKRKPPRRSVVTRQHVGVGMGQTCQVSGSTGLQEAFKGD